jgi:hypothetical protein
MSELLPNTMVKQENHGYITAITKTEYSNDYVQKMRQIANEKRNV